MDIITQHPALFAIAAYWAFSALVGGMPPPDDNSSKGYTWLHGSLHILAGNLSAAVAQKYPNLPNGGTLQVTDTHQQTTKVVPASDAEAGPIPKS